jgi:polyhydroxyalkanoate synthesis regulator phasin
LQDARKALGAAEVELERQVRALMERSGVDMRRAAETLGAVRSRLERQRHKAVSEVASRLKPLQARARKERQALARAVEDRVRATLTALDIPSRRDVHQLTRRVEELSRKIDRRRAR